MDKEQNKASQDDDIIEWHTELDEEALDVIIRLYDKTIKILACKESTNNEKGDIIMTNDNKLELIMKMIAENREEMRSGFKNINHEIEKVNSRIENVEIKIENVQKKVDNVEKKVDYLTEQTQIIKEQVVRNSESFVKVEELQEDVGFIEEQLVAIKKRTRN